VSGGFGTEQETLAHGEQATGIDEGVPSDCGNLGGGAMQGGIPHICRVASQEYMPG